MKQVVLKGAEVKLLIGGKTYPPCKEVTYKINYGEEATYGIDSAFPQEISTTRVSVEGAVSGIKIKSVGGLQGYDIKTRIQDILHAPYITMSLKNRSTDKTILWLPQTKVTEETISIRARGVVVVSFRFKAIIPYNELDIS